MHNLSSNCITLILIFVGTLGISSGEDLPVLRLSEERLLEDGVPQMSITFPNGRSDRLILNRISDDCHYSGHLENEREACVAVTGCLGQEDLELTVLSKHASVPMMRWTMDGTVERINLPEGRKATGKISIDSGLDELKENKEEEAALKKIEEQCKDGSCADQIQRTHTLEYRILYDDRVAEILGANAEKDMRAALVHTQAMFCHSSLGSKVLLKELSIERATGMRFYYNKKGERAWDLAGKYAKGADLVLQFEGCPEAGCSGSPGWAPVGTMCGAHDVNRWAYVRWSGPAMSGMIMAHEIGHTFGMANEGKGCEVPVTARWAGYGNIMSYASTVNRAWSNCSRAAFEAHYIQMKDKWCLPETPNACEYKSNQNSENYKYVGCYNGFDWMTYLGSNGMGVTAEECQKLVTYSFKNYTLFGVTDYRCYGAMATAPPQGITTSQSCSGQRGYGGSVGVFQVTKQEVPKFKSLGCWKDRRSPRALPTMLKYKGSGLSNIECYDLVIQENKLRASKTEPKEPITFFGVQDWRECWVTDNPDPKTSYQKYGTSNKCRAGRGGGWANSVYQLNKV